MIAGMVLEYAQARIHARQGDRPDDRLWAQLHGSRGMAALLEALRASALRHWVAGIGAETPPDEIESALRVHLRECIAETAGWMPAAWQPAVLWTRHLIDLPALAALAAGEAPHPWMLQDAATAAYAGHDGEARRAMLRNSPLAFVAAACEEPGPGAPAALYAGRAARIRRGWLAAWRTRWPDCSEADAGALADLAQLCERHLQRFAACAADETWSVRSAFQSALRLRFRRYASGPAIAFVWLALTALDMEHLRAELATRAAFRTRGDRA